MPRYFFNVRDPNGIDTIDRRGLELPDIEAASIIARSLALALADVDLEIEIEVEVEASMSSIESRLNRARN
jgi:hypothetical protein